MPRVRPYPAPGRKEVSRIKKRLGVKEISPCLGRDESFAKEFGLKGRPDAVACQRKAGEGTDHYGEGYCWWCEQEYMKMRGGKKVVEEAEIEGVSLPSDNPVVELMGREVQVAEQQMEIQKALTRAKGCLEEMVEMFRQVKEMVNDPKPADGLKEIAKTFNDMEYVDPEQGEEILQCVRVLCMGMTERGQNGPVPISSDTKFQLATKMGEQVRKSAETISKIAKDHFDVGKAAMIPRHVLTAHVPMFVGLVGKVADGDENRRDVGMKELMKVLASIDQKVEESK